MSVVTRQRSRLAVLAVLGLVGSLLAVSAGPSAAAGDGKPSNAAVYSACVAAATTDAGFTDMDGGHAKAAANCLAHYGITTGTAPGVFSPSAQVTRAQMAVFLSRAAGPAGVDLGAASDQGFSDIGGYSMMFRDAINRVAKAGIMKGTSMSMFSPDALVSRADMAVFLDGFVSKARIGPGGLGGASKYADVKPDDDPFTDVGGVPFGTYGSIRKVYELGIAAGTGGGMFSPDRSVTRNQMALFITRALAHTNARPAGLSLQADKPMTDTGSNGGFMLHAAHRSSTHMPRANTTLDFFSAASAGAAFDQDGLCKTLSSGVSDPAAVSSRCLIDTGDETTDSDGNVVTEVAGASAYCAGSKRVWTWTGAANARFDADTTTAAFVDVGISKHWRSINVSSDLKKHATHVRFGQSITYMFQLVDGAMGKGAAVAQKDVAIAVKFVETATPGSNSRTVLQTRKTDASGRVQVSFSYDDPNPATTGQEVKVVLTGPSGAMGVFLGTAPAPAAGGGAPPAPPGGRGQGTNPVTLGTVTWTDANPAAARLILSQAYRYRKASDAGDGARNTVEALLVDQYGDPVEGIPVHFWSDANNHNSRDADDGLGGKSSTVNGGPGQGLGSVNATFYSQNGVEQGSDSRGAQLGTKDNFAITRNTNSRGVARITYSRDSADSQIENIGAIAQIGLRDGAGTPANTERDDILFMDTVDRGPTDTWVAPLFLAWAKDPGTTALGANPNHRVLFMNKSTKEIVIWVTSAGNTIYLVKYDSNDQFNAQVGGATTGVSMEAFENSLVRGNDVSVQMASDPVPGVNMFTNRSAGPAAVTPCHT